METGNGERPCGKRNGLNAVYALISAVEAKEPSNEGHSRKVNTYAVALAEVIGLSLGQVYIVSIAALVHDIGKVRIPREVLSKKDKLNEEDWKAIRAHPRLGAEIIKTIEELKLSDEGWKAIQTHPKLGATTIRNVKEGKVNLAPCVSIVLCHHERWDGGGYPKGLHGEQIPIEARIIAIAESFDAMTSVRPHCPALPLEEAIKQLKQGAGTQFDPKLVDAFIRIVEARPRR